VNLFWAHFALVSLRTSEYLLQRFLVETNEGVAFVILSLMIKTDIMMSKSSRQSECMAESESADPAE
jgi:hypothetical protein